MKDVTFNEIVDEIYEEFPVRIPKFIIKNTLVFALRVLFKKVRQERNEFKLNYCDISKIYEITNGKEVLGRAADLDETKIASDVDVAPMRRLPYYDIFVHNSAYGGKKKKVIRYRSNHQRKVV